MVFAHLRATPDAAHFYCSAHDARAKIRGNESSEIHLRTKSASFRRRHTHQEHARTECSFVTVRAVEYRPCNWCPLCGYPLGFPGMRLRSFRWKFQAITEALKKRKANPHRSCETSSDEVADRICLLDQVCGVSVAKCDLNVGVEGTIAINRRSCANPRHVLKLARQVG